MLMLLAKAVSAGDVSHQDETINPHQHVPQRRETLFEFYWCCDPKLKHVRSLTFTYFDSSTAMEDVRAMIHSRTASDHVQSTNQ